MMNAFDICVRFLDRKPESRLGSNGFDEIKNHPWFAGIDWDKLYRKEVVPPYKPMVHNSEDVGNIDREFLVEVPTVTPTFEGKVLTMDERNLILHPQFIYQDVEKETFSFLYVPYLSEREKINPEPFLSFLLEKADMDDSEMVDAVFGLYAKWEGMGEQFLTESVLHFWPREIKNIKETEKTELLMNEGQQDLLLVNEEKLQYDDTPTEQEERKLYGNGRQNRRVLNLSRLPVIIGRKPEYADVMINDASVEKMHVKVLEEDGHIYMEDLNAATGTFKNGVQLRPYERVELLREDEIKLGKLSFTYR